ncbi:hypothetical protein [Deferrisoma sp.]
MTERCDRCGTELTFTDQEPPRDVPRDLQDIGRQVAGVDRDATLCAKCRRELGLRAAGSLFG